MSGITGKNTDRSSGVIGTAAAGGGTPDDDTVTSAKIVDGAILNADINASAAIAQSKLVDIVNADIGAGAAIVYTKMLRTDVPSFDVTPSAKLSNVTGDGTTYPVVFNHEDHDQGSNFASNTFTAPVAGVYLLMAHSMISGLTSAADLEVTAIITSNQTYQTQTNENNGMHSQIDPVMFCITFMDASDTATMTVRVLGESSNVCDVNQDTFTRFQGCLIG